MMKRLTVTAVSAVALTLFSFAGVSNAASAHTASAHAASASAPAGKSGIYSKIEDCQAQGNADTFAAGGPKNLRYSCEPTDVQPGGTPDCPDGCIGGHWALDEWNP